MGKVCTKMPFSPTGQVFWLENNVIVFAPKQLVDSIFSGPRKKIENTFKRKKNSCKICKKIPLIPTGQ